MTRDASSEEIPKNDLASGMKRNSVSLQELDSTTPQSSGNPMAFSFTNSSNEQSVSASTRETIKMTVVVDSGALDHYVDDKIVKSIRQLMFDNEEFNTP